MHINRRKKSQIICYQNTSTYCCKYNKTNCTSSTRNLCCKLKLFRTINVYADQHSTKKSRKIHKHKTDTCKFLHNRQHFRNYYHNFVISVNKQKLNVPLSNIRNGRRLITFNVTRLIFSDQTCQIHIQLIYLSC